MKIRLPNSRHCNQPIDTNRDVAPLTSPSFAQSLSPSSEYVVAERITHQILPTKIYQPVIANMATFFPMDLDSSINLIIDMNKGSLAQNSTIAFVQLLNATSKVADSN